MVRQNLKIIYVLLLLVAKKNEPGRISDFFRLENSKEGISCRKPVKLVKMAELNGLATRSRGYDKSSYPNTSKYFINIYKK